MASASTADINNVSSNEVNATTRAKKKRKRGRNFSKADKILLMNLVKHHDKDGILSGRMSKARSVGVADKNKTWEIIIRDFNAASLPQYGEPANCKQLANLFNHIKDETR